MAEIGDIEKLAKIFMPERYVYLGLTTISAIIVLSLATYSIFTGISVSAALAMFGTSGVISVTIGSVLKAWRDAVNSLPNNSNNGSGFKINSKISRKIAKDID